MPDSPPQSASQLPKFVGKYKIIRMIARSNDIVYEAVDPNLGRHVALKELLLAQDLTGAARRERIERFQREAKAAGALKHPNIVTIYEVAQHLEHRFIAMEYLEGQTLRQAINVGGPMSITEALRISLQLCDALGYAHAQGVVHRDVKPDNIHLIQPNNTVKLTDFGIARVLSEPSITSAGQVFGTPSYMSPEQLTSRQVDHRSDIFSSAVVIYEMIVGKKPFRGENVVAVTYQIMNAEVQMPSTIPSGIAAVLTRALAKDPDQRYQNMRAVAMDLRREMPRADNPFALESAPGDAAGKTVSIAAQGSVATDSAKTVQANSPTGATMLSSQTSDTREYAHSEPTSLIRAMDADDRVSRAVLKLVLSGAASLALVGLTIWGVVAAAQRFHTNALHNQAIVVYDQAIAAAASGDLATAIKQYRQVIGTAAENDPTDLVDRSREGMSDCYTAQGVQFQTAGNLDSAQESYNSALDFYNDNPVTHYDLATLYQSRGDQVDAMTEFSQAYQVEPLSAAGVSAKQQAEQGYLALGEQDFSSGNLSRARDNWQHVIDLDPSSSYADQARERMQRLAQ
jgi:serine/threonine protein kinase